MPIGSQVGFAPYLYGQSPQRRRGSSQSGGQGTLRAALEREGAGDEVLSAIGTMGPEPAQQRTHNLGGAPQQKQRSRQRQQQRSPVYDAESSVTPRQYLELAAEMASQIEPDPGSYSYATAFKKPSRPQTLGEQLAGIPAPTSWGPIGEAMASGRLESGRPPQRQPGLNAMVDLLSNPGTMQNALAWEPLESPEQADQSRRMEEIAMLHQLGRTEEATALMNQHLEGGYPEIAAKSLKQEIAGDAEPTREVLGGRFTGKNELPPEQSERLAQVMVDEGWVPEVNADYYPSPIQRLLWSFGGVEPDPAGIQTYRSQLQTLGRQLQDARARKDAKRVDKLGREIRDLRKRAEPGAFGGQEAGPDMTRWNPFAKAIGELFRAREPFSGYD